MIKVKPHSCVENLHSRLIGVHTNKFDYDTITVEPAKKATSDDKPPAL